MSSAHINYAVKCLKFFFQRQFCQLQLGLFPSGQVFMVPGTQL